MPEFMKSVLETLAQGRDLSPEQAQGAFARLMSGELSDGQAGALLMGLRVKGETPQELAAAVSACLAKARLVPGLSDKIGKADKADKTGMAGPRIDTCGTGGDNTCSFNCSTAVALILASLGYKVVKHGNRSLSSKCGSADVLEAMGLPLDTGPEAVGAALERSGFVFLFAPGFHPAFRHVMSLRKVLGIRTLFNLMGPLLNPARPTHQVLGVPDAAILPLMAETLRLTGVQRAAVVHGAGGYDELTPFGPGQVAYLRDGGVELARLDPAELGLADDRPQAVTVSGPQEALAVLRAILAGQGPEPARKMVALNLAMALHLLEDMPLADAASKAMEAVRSGRAARHFENIGNKGGV